MPLKFCLIYKKKIEYIFVRKFNIDQLNAFFLEIITAL